MASEGFAAPWVEFEKLIGMRPRLHGPTHEDLLSQWANLGGVLVNKLTFPEPDNSVTSEDRTIGNGLQIRIYTPPGYVKGSKPIGIYIHGGGWAMGDIAGDEPFMKPLIKGAEVVMVSIEYRLAPEHRYPAGLDDCVTGFNYALENAVSLGGVAGKIFICGVSAGGGSAFGTALRIVDEGKKDSIAGIISQVPCCVHPDVVPEHLQSKYTSYDEHAEHTIDTKRGMLAFWELYGAPKGDMYANPILHPRLKDLPKSYITVAGHDSLRDDGRLMIELLKEAGVEVKYDEFPGYPHYFWTFPAPCLEEPAKDYTDKTIRGIKFVVD